MSALHDDESLCLRVPTEMMDAFDSLKSKEDLDRFKDMIIQFLVAPRVELMDGIETGDAMLASFSRLIGQNSKIEQYGVDPLADSVPGLFMRMNEHMLKMERDEEFDLRPDKQEKTVIQREREHGVYSRDINDIVMDLLPLNFRKTFALNWRNIETGSLAAAELRYLERQTKIKRNFLNGLRHTFTKAVQDFVSIGKTEAEQRELAILAGQVLGSNDALYSDQKSREIIEEMEREKRNIDSSTEHSQTVASMVIQKRVDDLWKEYDKIKKKLPQAKADLKSGAMTQGAYDDLVAKVAAARNQWVEANGVLQISKEIHEQQRRDLSDENQTNYLNIGIKARLDKIQSIREQQLKAKEVLGQMARDDFRAANFMRVAEVVRRTIDEASALRSDVDEEFAEEAKLSMGIYLPRLYLTAMEKVDEAQKRIKAVGNADEKSSLFKLKKRAAERAAEDLSKKYAYKFSHDWEDRIAQAIAVTNIIKNLEASEDGSAADKLAQLEEEFNKLERTLPKDNTIESLLTKDENKQNKRHEIAPMILYGDRKVAHGMTFT